MQTEAPVPAPSEEVTPIGPARAFVVRSPRRTWGVPLLLLLNGAVFGAMLASGAAWDSPGLADVLRFGASHGPYVAQGDWWRLCASAFVHIGLLHFAVNMISLFALRIVESFYGSGAFLLLYLLCAVGASACSLLWHPSLVSAGASGALFGLAGALIAFVLAHRHSIPELLFRPMLRNLIVLLALNLFFGAMLDHIDNVAHLGGLATGLLVGRALDRNPQKSARLDRRRLARAAVPAILVGLLCALIPWRSASAADIRLQLAGDRAQHQLRLGQRDEALRIVEEGLARDATHPDLLGVRASIRVLEGDPRAALTDLDALLYQRPEDARARRMRATLLRVLQRDEEALRDALLLVQQSPDDPRYRQLAGELYWCLGDWRAAAIEFGVLARRKGEGAIEGQLFLWLARCRMGEEEQATRELRHYLDRPHFWEDNSLDVTIGGLFAGQESLAELLTTFDRHGASRAQRTRLYYFAALWRERQGAPDQARELLRKALEGGASSENTWELARHELELLEKR
jgi:rhomboid protease GluP